MWKRKKEPKGADNLVVIYDKAQKLIAKYESTQDAGLLNEMRVIKPKLQEAVSAESSLLAKRPEMTLLKPLLASAYNILGGLSLYLEEYGEAWDVYEKCRQLALELQDEKDVVQSTTGSGLVAKIIVEATNNLGSVALNQGDFDVALEQFQMAASFCSDLSSEDKWISKQIERNIEMAKSKLDK